MNKLNIFTILAACAFAGILGCGGENGSTTSRVASGDNQYLAATEPAGATGVGDALASASDQQDVVLVGRIGGSTNPFVEGVAAFTIVDVQVPYCPEEEGCPTPWDYCCKQNEVQKNIAMVKVIDADGKPVAEDSRQLLGVKELNTVVVCGKAQRDDAGNLTVLANKLFIRN